MLVRAVRSWWIVLAPLLWLNWTAFVYAGLRGRNRRWLAAAGVYLAVSATSLVCIAASDEGSALEQFGVWLGVLSWGVSFVHALAIRGEFLERLEALDDPALTAAELKLRRRELARRLARENPVRARELGVGRPDVRGAFHGGLVDLNSAPVETIDRLPGVKRELAQRIVRMREDLDGFSSLDDMGLVLDLPQPLVDKIRERVICIPR